MRIFVASWFFPPLTTSEANVAYKLLSHSRHQYDVCSSLSQQWTYKHESALNADNIEPILVQTDDIDEWVERAVAVFRERHAERPYDAIMTRTMPPESVLVAAKIRKEFPDIPWIASLADPIAKNPYEVQDIVWDSRTLSMFEKHAVANALSSGGPKWNKHPHPGVRHLFRMKQIEDYAVVNATVLIFPCNALRSYVLGERRRPGTVIVPHSFDLTGIERKPGRGQHDPVVLTFLGHSDAKRSLEPLVDAVALLRQQDPEAVSHLRFRFVGNVPDRIQTIVFNKMLQNIITIEPGVDYQTSLQLAQDSDWLIHVDAYFAELKDTGGSVFLAAKIADYMGTERPILAITGKGSPADEVVRRAGGVTFDARRVADIAAALGAIADGSMKVRINREYRDQFIAATVAKHFDAAMERALGLKDFVFTRTWWPSVSQSPDKFLTVCVPAYKVEPYLDRCLFSLVNSDVAGELEIIVVNDGSPDHSREIADAYEQRYPGTVRVITKENGGHGSTINAALAAATGEYFRVVDGDDWVDGASLTKLVRHMQRRNMHPDLVSSDYYQVYIDDGHTVEWAKAGETPYYKVVDFADADLSMEYFTMASAMFKTNMLRDTGFKLQENTFYVDVEYLLFAIPYVQTVMFAPEHVYRYAVGNPDQSINERVFLRRYDHHDRVIRRMVTYMSDKDMGEGQRSYVESLFVRHLLRSHYLLSLIWDTDKKRGARRAKEFDQFLAHENAPLHAAMAVGYRGVRQARLSGFSPKTVARLKSLETGTRGQPLPRRLRHLAGAAARFAARTSLGQVLIATPLGQRFKQEAKRLAGLS